MVVKRSHGIFHLLKSGMKHFIGLQRPPKNMVASLEGE
jgi:hypothetical protein